MQDWLTKRRYLLLKDEPQREKELDLVPKCELTPVRRHPWHVSFWYVISPITEYPVERKMKLLECKCTVHFI